MPVIAASRYRDGVKAEETSLDEPIHCADDKSDFVRIGLLDPTDADDQTNPRRAAPFGWSPVLAGAAIAAALLAVFFAFGSALGLAIASSAPTWRDASAALALLTGVYLLLAALTSFTLGGYVAGRLRGHGRLYPRDAGFYAGLRGLLTWAAAVLVIVFVTALTALASRPAVEAGRGNAGAAQSLAGEHLIAFELDRLLRSERRPADVDLSYPRAEAARILLTSSARGGVVAEDRTYLTTLVRTVTGLAPPDAERRVAGVLARAHESSGCGERPSLSRVGNK